jgi:SNF2 family DNA or RNA helicase
MAMGRRRTVVQWDGIRNEPELKKWLYGKYLKIKSDTILNLEPILYKDVLVSDIDDAEILERFIEYIQENKSVVPEVKKRAAMEKVPFTIQYAKNLLEEVDQLLIYSDHVDPVKVIAQNFEVPAITGEMPVSKRAEAVADFQAGKIKVIVATIGSLSTGVTLTAANNLIYNDYAWVPGDLDQVEGRINRMGQTKRCIVHRILGSPQDKYILERIESKREVIRRAE